MLDCKNTERVQLREKEASSLGMAAGHNKEGVLLKHRHRLLQGGNWPEESDQWRKIQNSNYFDCLSHEQSQQPRERLHVAWKAKP